MHPLIVAAGAFVTAAGGTIAAVLYPPLPRDLGGAPNLDAESERVRIPVGRDALDAWVIPGRRDAVIVLFHGFGRTHHRAWRYASFLRRLGVHLVTVDFRSSNWRGRKPTTLGLHEREDARAVLDWVRREPRFAGCRIGLLGESLGAAIALDLAAEHGDVAAVVADCAFARAWQALEHACERFARLPRRPGATVLRSIGRAATGYDPGTFSPVDVAHLLADRPVFFIHGADDNRVGDGQARMLWRAAGAKDPLWIVEDCGHTEAWRRHPQVYERRVTAFFAHALFGEGAGVACGELADHDADPAAADEDLRAAR